MKPNTYFSAMTLSRLTYTCAVGLLLYMNSGFTATAIHSLKDIESVATEYLQNTHSNANESVTISLRPVDKRLRLAQCSTPLEPFSPPGARSIGHTSVGIRCDGIKPWKIFVSAKISVSREVWTTNKPLHRGEIVQATDLNKEFHLVHQSNSALVPSSRDIVGFRLRQNLNAGEALRDHVLEKNKIVRRGDKLTLVAQAGGIEVRAQATALSDAASGERIRVRNENSQLEVEGILTKDRLVYINI